VRGDLERDAASAFLAHMGWDNHHACHLAADRYLRRKYPNGWQSMLPGSWDEFVWGFSWPHLLSWHVYRAPRWTPLHLATSVPV